MNKGVLYTISILIAVIFLSGCAGKEAIVTNSSENREIEQCYVYTFEGVDISYYPEVGKFTLDNHNIQKEYMWNVGMNDAEDEIVFKVGRFLDNEKKQIVFHPVIGVGTGTLIEELHVIDLETLEEYVVEDFEIDEEQILIPKSLDREKIIVGSYQYYELKENHIIVKLNASIDTYEILGEFEGILGAKDGKLYVREWKATDEYQAKQIVFDTYNEYLQMYGDAWLWAYERAEGGTVCELEEGVYYKINDSIISIEEIKAETEAVCTKEYAKREFYDKLLEKESPYYLEKDGVVYLQQAEMPGIITGDIKEINIIERKEDYIQAQFIGENLPLGDTITGIVIVKEGDIWKVDNFVEDIKE